MKNSDLRRREALYRKLLNFSPRKGDLRKAELLEATIYCLSHLGIENTTFESIGQRCKMKKAHVVYYYPNKDELVESALKLVVAHVQDITVEFVSQKKHPIEILKAFIEGTFHWVENYPDEAPLIPLLYYLSMVYPAYKRLHHEVREVGAQRLFVILESLNPKAEPPRLLAAAKYIQTLLTGYLIEYSTTESAQPLVLYFQRTWDDTVSYLKNKKILLPK